MNEDTSEEGSFMQRLKESPRTVSALIIILIVAAAIYAFSGEENSPQVASQETEIGKTSEEAAETGIEEGDHEDSDGEIIKEGQVKTGEAKGTEEVIELPEPTRTEQGYVEVAEKGNGATHLARKATNRWLTENQAGYAVTAEHRIYMEDYIRKQMPTGSLSLGDTQLVTYELIAEAAARAGELTEDQLLNLSQYTSVLN